MANYFEMTRDELTAEKAALEEKYKKFQAMGLKLNMARGKPGPHQMDLAMGLLQMTDYTTDAGTDARNYGDLEGLHEARELFGDVMGVKPEEVFVGGNSSLQIMAAEHAGVESHLREGTCDGSHGKCHVALHFSASHLGIDNIVVHGIESQQAGCHFPVQRE